MWRLSFLTAAIALCPKFIETEIESAECIREYEEGFVLSPCPANYTCPAAPLSQIARTACEPIPKSDEDSEPREPECDTYQDLGQICDHGLRCGWGLYCFDGTCVKVKKWGQRCNNYYECREGTVCNKGRCELLFELEEGEESDSRTACASARIFNGTCAPASLTVGSLPRMCEEDIDCISTAQQVGNCLCAANGAGQGFCTLHESDPPLLSFIAAMRDEKFELANLLLTFTMYYPIVVGTEGNWTNVVSEVVENRTAFDHWKECAAGSLVVAAGLLWF